jgi:hypothetical protein
MTENYSALVILLSEGLVVTVLLTIGMYAYYRHKHGKEVTEIERFVEQMNDDETLKTSMLETILLEKCGLSVELVAKVLPEVTSVERALMQKIIQMFLAREPELLAEIDQLIGNISEPYCQILKETHPAAGSPVTTAAGNGGGTVNAEMKISGLERINQQLVRQLDTAMKTIDEITTEYTRVFSGTQTALELDNSSKKMIQIFLEAEERIKEKARAGE